MQWKWHKTSNNNRTVMMAVYTITQRNEKETSKLWACVSMCSMQILIRLYLSHFCCVKINMRKPGEFQSACNQNSKHSSIAFQFRCLLHLMVCVCFLFFWILLCVCELLSHRLPFCSRYDSYKRHANSKLTTRGILYASLFSFRPIDRRSKQSLSHYTIQSTACIRNISRF